MTTDGLNTIRAQEKLHQFLHYKNMIETKACKTMRGFVEQYECLCCRKKIVQHLLTGCKTTARAEYKRQHINALKVLAVKWAIDNRLLLEGTKWFGENWEKGKTIESNGKKL